MIILLLLLLLMAGILVTDLLAYLPLSLLNVVHLPRWLGWLLLLSIVVGLMGDGPGGPSSGDRRSPLE
mgnify:CR=1 FL=1